VNDAGSGGTERQGKRVGFIGQPRYAKEKLIGGGLGEIGLAGN